MAAKGTLVVLGALFVLGCLPSSAAEPEQPVEASLDDLTVQTRHLILVRQRLRTGSAQLVVPICATDEAQYEYLCGLGVRLEVHVDRGWGPATPTPSMGILGGMPLSKASPRLIAANSSAEFAFEFAKDVFILNPGQPVRLVVDAWPSVEAMRANGPPIRLVGPSFRVP